MTLETVGKKASNDATLTGAVAIIGMSCRFPGANSPEQFWSNLLDGKHALDRLTEEELEQAGVPRRLLKDSAYVAAGAFLDYPVGAFDASYFGYTPKEASVMDPQQRHFLECASLALEDAGYDVSAYRGKVGVFAGCLLSSYLRSQPFPGGLISDPEDGFLNLISSDKDTLATRVGFKLNLRGPCVTVQTFCSTSLVATHLAIQSLRSGDCDMALSGAAAIRVPHRTGYLYQNGGIQAPDGICRPFDVKAKGTILGNGVGVIVLKRLVSAVRDGDAIYAVIRGTAINNDGAAKAGFTAPSPTGQAGVIRDALNDGNIDPASIQFIEAHGTATPLGDPIEVEGLGRVYKGRDDGYKYILGAVKGNIGHLDCAAGVAGVMKTALCLNKKTLVPTLHFKEANPELNLSERPFIVGTEVTPWLSSSIRRAGVSSFGIGGTNAHVVLEEAPASESNHSGRGAHVVLLSGVDDEGLASSIGSWKKSLSGAAAPSISEVSYTSQVGRRALPVRAAFVASDVSELVDCLDNGASGAVARGNVSRRSPYVVFLFPGQGSQKQGMGRELYDQEPLFKTHFDKCRRIVKELSSFDLLDVIAHEDKTLEQPRFAHACIFSIEYALAKTLMAWGVTPSALMGHSLGEMVAAVCAGVFSLEDALRFVVERARLLEEIPQGSMLAVSIERAKLAPYLSRGEVFLAAENAPRQCILSGEAKAIQQASCALDADGFISAPVNADKPYHTKAMNSLHERLSQMLQGVPLNKPSIPIVSGVTGRWLTKEQAQSVEYWVSQISIPVEFSTGIRALQKNPDAVFVEVGPGSSLSSMVMQHESGNGAPRAVSAIHNFASTHSEQRTLMNLMAKLWTWGQRVDWQMVNEAEPQKRAHLPGHPFRKTEFWLSTTRHPENPVVCAHAASTLLSTHDKTSGRSSKDFIVEQLEALAGQKFDESSLDLEFTELGLDSLLLTKVVSDVKKAFGIELNFRQLVDELSTPRRLIARLGDEQPRKKRGDRADAKTSSPGTASDAAHGPFKRAVKSKRELTTEQSVFLAELSAEYNAKTGKSKEQAAAYRNSFCDPRGAGGFRAEWKEMVYPIVCARSRGALLWDVDNNEYIDITLGFGANYLGHSPKFVVNAVREQLKSGFEVGPQTPLAGVVADKLCRITGFDRATFCNTGSEAVIAAMRVARASTGRDKIAMFSGSYHGIFDSVLAYGNDARVGMAAPVAAGIPESAVADTVILPYVDDRALQFIRDNAHDLAGVIVEPVQARHMNRRPDTFLRDLRKTTTERDVPLIFDEIVTGFRCALGGAQEYFGVKADMATYGKIIGGGMPIGALAGKAHYMNHLDGGVWSYGDASGPTTPVTFFAGTFVRHPLAMAACNSVLDFLYSKGSALQKLVTERVEKFASRLRSFCESEGIPLVVNQFASLVNLHVPPGQEFFGLLYYLLRLRGIHAWEGRLIHFSIEHTDENMDVVFNHYAESLMILKKLGFLDEERGVGA